MKKSLVMLLTAIMVVMSATMWVSASESVEVVGEQRFALDERVEIPDVCVFSITAIELTAAEEEGFQQLSFILFFQNMSLNAVNLGDFMEWELKFQNRFSFELVNVDELEQSAIRPLVRRTVTLVFELPDAALSGEPDDLLLSLSFDGSIIYQLDVLVAFGLVVDLDDMDIPIIILGRNMPLLTPGRWMNLGRFATRLTAVNMYEMIPDLLDGIEIDESEVFLVTSLSLRNLSQEEFGIEGLVSAELIFRDRFVFEHIGEMVSKENISPLEEATVYLAFLVPDIIFDNNDEELWVNFVVGDMDLTVEIRDVITEGGSPLVETSEAVSEATAVVATTDRSEEPQPIEDNSTGVNVPITGRLSTVDTVNTHEIVLDNHGKVSLTFEHASNNDNNVFWGIGLYDENNSLILFIESRGDQVMAESINAYLSKGKYYVRVATTHWRHSNIEYTLNVNYEVNDGRFEIEPNDTMRTATALRLNMPIIGNLRNVDDVDFFTFTLNEPGKISLTFEHPSNNDGNVFWGISLYDSNNSRIQFIESRGNEIKVDGINVYLSPGTYFVRISTTHWRHWAVDYKLTVNHEINDGRYEIEPNETIETVTEMRLNEPIIGNLSHAGDVDFFTFTLDSSNRVSLTFTHPSNNDSNVFWGIGLFDRNNTRVIYIESRGNDVRINSDIADLSEGQYFVRISTTHWRHWDTDYTLIVNTH